MSFRFDPAERRKPQKRDPNDYAPATGSGAPLTPAQWQQREAAAVAAQQQVRAPTAPQPLPAQEALSAAALADQPPATPAPAVQSGLAPPPAAAPGQVVESRVAVPSQTPPTDPAERLRWAYERAGVAAPSTARAPAPAPGATVTPEQRRAEYERVYDIQVGAVEKGRATRAAETDKRRVSMGLKPLTPLAKPAPLGQDWQDFGTNVVGHIADPGLMDHAATNTAIKQIQGAADALLKKIEGQRGVPTPAQQRLLEHYRKSVDRRMPGIKAAYQAKQDKQTKEDDVRTARDNAALKVIEEKPRIAAINKAGAEDVAAAAEVLASEDHDRAKQIAINSLRTYPDSSSSGRLLSLLAKIESESVRVATASGRTADRQRADQLAKGNLQLRLTGDQLKADKATLKDVAIEKGEDSEAAMQLKATIDANEALLMQTRAGMIALYETGPAEAGMETSEASGFGGLPSAKPGKAAPPAGTQGPAQAGAGAGAGTAAPPKAAAADNLFGPEKKPEDFGLTPEQSARPTKATGEDLDELDARIGDYTEMLAGRKLFAGSKVTGENKATMTKQLVQLKYYRERKVARVRWVSARIMNGAPKEEWGPAYLVLSDTEQQDLARHLAQFRRRAK